MTAQGGVSEDSSEEVTDEETKGTSAFLLSTIIVTDPAMSGSGEDLSEDGAMVVSEGSSNELNTETTGYVATVTDGSDTTECSTIADAFTAANNAGTATITLFADCTVKAKLTVDQGSSITFDLNGYTLDGSGNTTDWVIYVKGNMVLKDSNNTGKIIGGRRSVYVDGAGASFSMEGGTILNNNSIIDAGVYVQNGSFEMSGGEVTGIASNNAGAGVVLANGSFKMTGGKITNNTTEYHGAGVFVTDGSTFTMSGGEISGNSARSGAGVYINKGSTFTMSGGTISGNTVSSNGGGVYAYGSFILSGTPVITGNTKSSGSTNNVYLFVGNEITLSEALTSGAEVGVYIISGQSVIPITATESNTSYYYESAQYFSSDNGYYIQSNTNGYVEESRTHTHSWEQTWDWAEDYSKVKVSFVCTKNTGHTWQGEAEVSSKVTVEATCTEPGVRTYTATVDLEDGTYTDTRTEEIPATGHTLTKTEAKAATCTEDGYAFDFWYCETCDTYFSDENAATEIALSDVVTRATGHNWASPVWTWSEEQEAAVTLTCLYDSSHTTTENATVSSAVTVEPTCTEDGVRTYTAKVSIGCKTFTDTKTEAIDAAGHTWDDGTVTTEATETTEGVRTYTCTVCGETRTEAIPATGGEAEPVKDGLTLDDDGVYRYYQNNVFAEDYVGVASYEGGLFFIKDGLVDSGANELCLYDDVWYYVSKGQVQLQYTGLAMHDGAWFYVTEGILDTSVKGLIPYDGALFLVSDGQMRFEYNGLWLNAASIGGDDCWYFLAAGKVQQYTGIAAYNGAFFVVTNGVFDFDYNGTVEYDGTVFTVVNGQLYG